MRVSCRKQIGRRRQVDKLSHVEQVKTLSSSLSLKTKKRLMKEMWPEVSSASSARRRELSLTGSKLTSLLESTNDAIDPDLFKLSELNFLSLTHSSRLCSLSEDINKLGSLSTLILSNNTLQVLPPELKLPKLKTLDLSGNKIASFPSNDYFVHLVNLVSLNLAENALSTFDNQSLLQCKALSRLDLRTNSIEDMTFVTTACPSTLSELVVASNKLSCLPDDVSEKLPNLKLLDVAHNKLECVPKKLGLCTKLKELNLKENEALKDTRLKKLIQQKGTKPVLEYIRQHGVVSNESDDAKSKTSGKASKTKLKKENNHRKGETEVEEEKPLYTIEVLKTSKGQTILMDTAAVKDVRGVLVCCVVRNVDLSTQKLKNFIQIQTKLHEGMCQRRLAATIATHDFDKLKFPLLYTTKEPCELFITPLNGHKKQEATVLVSKLRDEAEALRKEKKRNTVSGLHKYLSLLDDLESYACLIDAKEENNRVVSFPPITNCEETKIDSDTRNVFIEVTSSRELKMAKLVADALIASMVEAGLARRQVKEDTSSSSSSSSSDCSSDEEAEINPVLQVEPLRVLDKDGGALRLVYPSRVDLNFDAQRRIRVNRK